MNNDNIPTQGSKVHFNWGYHFTDNFHDFHRWEFKTNRYFFLGVERYEITRAEQKETGNLDFKKIKKLMEYKNLKNKIFDRKVITTQFVVSQTHGVDGHNVPFYALSAVGNDTPMRGYKSSPFRDNAMLAFSAEYRFPMMMLVEGTLFNEYGMVGERLDKLDPADIKNSWGFGMRFSRKDFFLFRTQVGFHGSHLVPVFNLTVSAAY